MPKKVVVIYIFISILKLNLLIGIIYETVAKTDNGAITEMGVQNSSNRSDEKSFDAKPNFVDISPVPKRPDRLLSGKKKLGKLDSGKSINTINTNKPLKGFMKEETESVETDQNNQDRQDRQDNNHTDNPKRRRIESIFPGQEKGESSDKLESGDIIDVIQEKPTNKNISVSKSNVTKKVEKVGNININSANSGGVNNAEMPNNENHQNGEKDKDVDVFENERKDTADRILDDGNRI